MRASTDDEECDFKVIHAFLVGSISWFAGAMIEVFYKWF